MIFEKNLRVHVFLAKALRRNDDIEKAYPRKSAIYRSPYYKVPIFAINHSPMEEASLILVPTPIGNLEDITYRAVRVLKESDIILAEDTRVSGRLLQHYGIETRMMAFHQHNEHQSLEKIMEMLRGGQKLALITDAGSPGISDPGFLLARECIKNDIKIESLPGATAFVPALVNSGLPCDRFVFEGFLPHKKGRQSRLQKLKDSDYTLVFYESPFRLVKTLNQLAEHLGEERPACVSRELTKLHEENRRATLAELAQHYEKVGVKGEIVLCVAGKTE